MKFRPAFVGDIEALNAVSVASKRYWNYPEEWIERWLTDLEFTREKFEAQRIIVLEHEDRVIGFCAIAENQDDFEITNLWLLPQFIGKGLGKKLLAEAISRYTDQSKPLLVEADPNAVPFYKRQGFVIIDKVESFPPGRFLPIMKRDK